MLLNNERGEVAPDGIEQGENNEAPAAIDPAAYERIKNDMHKYKREAQEAREQKESYEAKLSSIETEQQKSQGQYKELFEARDAAYGELESKHKHFLNSVSEDKKLTAVREFAIKNNIRKEALDDLDMISLESVVVETTDQGRYNVLGADHFVDKLKSLKPHWFNDSTPPSGNFNTGDFDGAEKTYSGQELLALSKSDPVKYREILTNKQNLISRR